MFEKKIKIVSCDDELLIEDKVLKDPNLHKEIRKMKNKLQTREALILLNNGCVYVEQYLKTKVKNPFFHDNQNIFHTKKIKLKTNLKNDRPFFSI